MMFEELLANLRAQGVKVGVSEWLLFLGALKRGLAADARGLYELGRAVLIHSESDYDAYDLAYHATFAGIAIDPDLFKSLWEWLENPVAAKLGEMGVHNFANIDDLLEAFRKTLAAQNERHDGGNRWVGTGGTSPFGAGGQANQGVKVGGTTGNRSAVQVASEGVWKNYRTDQPLGVRDFKVALKALRHIAREGEEVLDLDATIAATAKNGGEIDLVFHKARANRVRVVLLMDSGGSMDPYEDLVSRLFTAAAETKTFKTFEHYYFHNCVYRFLWRDYANGDRVTTNDVLRRLHPEHRVIFVGDASMAPAELFSSTSSFGRISGDGLRPGIDNLRAIALRCPASVWLNPDPPRAWIHPTVSAIGDIFPMFPLTVKGLSEGIKFLRAPKSGALARRGLRIAG
jgi:uncharacterized protein with von Willebrand factor type A (vWA) domain